MEINELYQLFNNEDLFSKLRGDLFLNDSIVWTFDGLSENIVNESALYDIYDDDLDEIIETLAINNLENEFTLSKPIIINNMISFNIY